MFYTPVSGSHLFLSKRACVATCGINYNVIRCENTVAQKINEVWSFALSTLRSHHSLWKIGQPFVPSSAHATSCLHVIRRYMNLNDTVHIGDPSRSTWRRIVWELDFRNNIVICTQEWLLENLVPKSRTRKNNRWSLWTANSRTELLCKGEHCIFLLRRVMCL